jgi:hypothetical protein
MKSQLLATTVVAVLWAGLPASSQQAPTPPSPASPGGPAAPVIPAYRVELVIFRMATVIGGAENWSLETGKANVGGDEGGSGGNALGRLTGVLPAAQFQLTPIENRLRGTGVYVPVAHLAWTQTASAWGAHAGLPIDQLGLDVPGLTGTVSLERGQYLHLGLNLAYAMPNPPSGLGASPGTTFALNENRRVKFYERNYYDHPAFGVIALVTPAQGSRPPGR